MNRVKYLEEEIQSDDVEGGVSYSQEEGLGSWQSPSAADEFSGRYIGTGNTQ